MGLATGVTASLSKSLDEITADAQMLMRTLKRAGLPATIELQPCESQIGGGSLPLERLASVAVAIRPDNISVAELEERMRFLPVPIIPRVANDMVLMDVRTIDRKTFKLIADQLSDCMC